MGLRRASPRTTYAAPFDAVVLAITTVCVLVLGIVLYTFVFWQPGNSTWRALFGFAFVALLVGGSGFSPSGYRIEDDTLVIERRIGYVEVSLDDLQEVRTERRRPRALGILGFRNGGLFGVWGSVYRRDVGWTYFWGRRLTGVVILEFPRHRVMVMPDKPAAFAAAIRVAAWHNDW